MEPAELTVVVHSARGLQGKKKDRHKYSVVFGIGTDKFRTEVVVQPSGNPVWEEESLIPVDSVKKELVFKVQEKDDLLGQIRIPIADIPGPAVKRRTTAELQPHRKCPSPQGSLVYQAWVSKYKDDPYKDQNNSEKTQNTMNKVKHSLFAKSPVLKKKLNNLVQQSPIMGRKSPKMSKKSSLSMADLTTYNNTQKNFDDPKDRRGSMFVTHNINIDEPTEKPVRNSVSSVGKSDPDMLDVNLNSPVTIQKTSPSPVREKKLITPVETEKLTFSSSDDDEVEPEITGISPKEGPVTGGTKLTIRGSHLGKNKLDIIGLLICGSNCLSTLEYESPSKIYCTTKAWKPTQGHIVVQTQGGGKGLSLVQFTFKLPDPTETKSDVFTIKPSPSPVPPERKSKATKTESLPIEPPAVSKTEVQPMLNRGWRSEVNLKDMELDTVLEEGSGKPLQRHGSYGDADVRQAKSQSSTVEVDRTSSRSASPSPKPGLRNKFDRFKSNVTGEGRKKDKDRNSSGSESSREEVLKTEITKLQGDIVGIQEQFKDLQDQNKLLEEQNQMLRLYVDKLLTGVMHKCPEMLCVDLSGLNSLSLKINPSNC